MIRRCQFGILFLLVYSVTGHAASLLVLGDSLSANHGIEPQQGWVNLLQQRLAAHKYPYQIINASISGSTTSQGLTRLPELLTKHKPTIVIIQLGGNDGLRGLPVLVIRKNLRNIIEISTRHKAKVLLLGVRLPPNYGPAYTSQFQAIYADLAKQEKVAVVPLFLAGVDEKTDLMQDDGIHPRVAAQTLLLDNVWPQLKALL
ncbi:MAG: tesA [Gammaproteobacteria bacterium]|jgi:acyl-CoA thioesterase-1|nr:tesA [Gammaproteobacteria bacterium]